MENIQIRFVHKEAYDKETHFPHIYLLFICAEGLSGLLKRAEDIREIEGIRVCPGAPYVSHLLFL